MTEIIDLTLEAGQVVDVTVEATTTPVSVEVSTPSPPGPQGLIGPIGEQGPEGPQGIQGDTGEQGIRGDPGIITNVGSIIASDIEPVDPQVNDLWIDTSV